MSDIPTLTSSVEPTLTSSVEVVPGGPVRGSIRPPGSKSLTNRALICAAFADGQSQLSGALRSDDTEVMIAALRQVGVRIEETDAGRSLRVEGMTRQRFTPADRQLDLFIGNSGTSVRFLTAALSALGGNFRLHGVARMHERPIGDLVAALTPVSDGEVACESVGGCPPVVINTSGWSGDVIGVAGNVSSQYLSGLMMAAPITGKRVTVEVVGDLVSRPYVDMTARILTDFGARCELREQNPSDQDPRGRGLHGDGPQGLSPQSDADTAGSLICEIDGRNGYRGCTYAIEPDASAASYFWAAAAITGGEVTVQGLSADALQGDVKFVDVLEQMGCTVGRSSDSITVIGPETLNGIDIDMNAISDTVQTLSVVALFARGVTTVRGVAHNRFKETDRIGDLARELRKLGAAVTESADGLVITPGPAVGATLETYDDHRMAMSFALAGLRIAGVKIQNPACTAKTYPGFFADLEQLRGRPHRWRSDIESLNR